MYVNKFAYCEAAYVFSMLWHDGQSSEVYKLGSRASMRGYLPGASALRGKLEDPESRAYYRALCLKHGV